MAIEHVLAVVPVSDFDAAHRWYERLLGRPADNVPMPGSLAEWRVTGSGWVQVFHDPDRASTGQLNFAVDDLDAHLTQLTANGIVPGDIVRASKGVQLSTVADPDGNRITYIGNFRVTY